MPRKRKKNYMPFITFVAVIIILIAAIIFTVVYTSANNGKSKTPTVSDRTTSSALQGSTFADDSSANAYESTTVAKSTSKTNSQSAAKTTKKQTSTPVSSDSAATAYSNYISKFSAIPASGSVTKSKTDIKSGLQILVNNDYEYNTSQSQDLINMMNVSNRAYLVAYTDLDADRFTIQQFNYMNTGYLNKYGTKLQACSGYRSYQSQKSKFDASVERQGLEETLKWYTRPGHSEHHTGFAIDYNTNSFGSEAFTGQGNQAWVKQNCHKYGFILRYQADKKSITGVAAEAWHFRQVGIPHASYIMKSNLCLEEYISKLRSYSASNPLNITDDSGHSYAVYYVKSAGASTQVPIREGSKYTVSGNNVDGFIVTILK